MSVKSGRLAVLGVGLALLGGVIAGCGGDSDSVSKEDFIAKGDQICADFNEEAEAKSDAFNQALQSGDLKTAGDLFAVNADLMADGVEEFAALDVPEGDQGQIDEFIARSRDQAAAAADAAAAMQADDRKALKEAITVGNAAQAEADAIANEYGFTDCGNSEDSGSSAGTES